MTQSALVRISTTWPAPYIMGTHIKFAMPCVSGHIWKSPYQPWVLVDTVLALQLPFIVTFPLRTLPRNLRIKNVWYVGLHEWCSARCRRRDRRSFAGSLLGRWRCFRADAAVTFFTSYPAAFRNLHDTMPGQMQFPSFGLPAGPPSKTGHMGRRKHPVSCNSGMLLQRPHGLLVWTLSGAVSPPRLRLWPSRPRPLPLRSLPAVEALWQQGGCLTSVKGGCLL